MDVGLAEATENGRADRKVSDGAKALKDLTTRTDSITARASLLDPLPNKNILANQ